jgi:hypothetical protein
MPFNSPQSRLSICSRSLHIIGRAGWIAGAIALLLASALARSPAAKASPAHATHKTNKVRVVSAAAASLGPLETIVQSLNNCGPSSIAEVLAYWHIYRSEAQVAAVMRSDNSYWGMSPVYLPIYARSIGMRALVGYGGSERLVKLLIANGFPVIASQYVSYADPVRHYRPIERV